MCRKIESVCREIESERVCMWRDREEFVYTVVRHKYSAVAHSLFLSN